MLWAKNITKMFIVQLDARRESSRRRSRQRSGHDEELVTVTTVDTKNGEVIEVNEW